jgi:hypothetical protein
MTEVVTPQSVCRCGLARCDITPPVGIYHRMWGAATQDRASGIHRPLSATALAFQAAEGPTGLEREQVVIAADLCLLWAGEMEALAETICRQTGLVREQLTVAFSHTHASGLMGLERVKLPGGDLIPPYLEALADRLTALVRDARRTVQPVTILYGTGRSPLAGNRDFWDETSKQFVCGYNPAGPADDTILAARIVDAAGKTVATVVNYACHPTTLAWENTLISPDFPGAMREVVEGALGAPCVFVQGASGDVGPREGYVADPEIADRNGRQIGYAALAALEGLPPAGTCFQYQGPVISGATLGTWAHVPLDEESLRQKTRWRCRRWLVPLPYREDLQTRDQTQTELGRWQAEEQAALNAGDTARAQDCRAMVERMTRWLNRLASLPPGKTFPLPVVLWQMGDAFWLAVEGEYYQLFQVSLRQRIPGTPLVVATIANGSRPTYLPPRETYGKGIYQESIAILAPGSLEQVIAQIGRQIEAWRTHGEAKEKATN